MDDWMVPHWHELLSYFRKRVNDEQTAADLVQDVMVRAIRTPAMRECGVLHQRKWLFTVAGNLLIDRSRARKTWERPLTFDRATTEDVERDAVSRDEWQRTRRCLDAIHPAYRDVLLLAALEVPTRAASELLGVVCGTQKSRLWRGRQALRAMLDAPAG